MQILKFKNIHRYYEIFNDFQIMGTKKEMTAISKMYEHE